MSTIALLIAAFVAAQIILGMIARPYQKRVVALVVELRATEMSGPEREFVEGLGRSVYSWRTAIVLALIFLTGLFESGDILDRDYARFAAQKPVLAHDHRVHELSDTFFAAALLANPIAGAFAAAFRYAFRLKSRIHKQSKCVDVSEMMIAASRV